ncbi:MAG: transporter substrate-binding domain-containing protein [Bacillota bacterium]
MSKIFFKSMVGTFILALMVISASYTPAYAATAPQATLIASGHPEWAPVMWRQGNQIVGVGADLVRIMCNDLGISCETRAVGMWDVVQDGARAGKIDLLVGAYKTDARQKYLDYSIAYASDPVVLFVRKGSTLNYSGWSDLVGKKGVVTLGDSYGSAFDEYIKANLKVTAVGSAQDAFAQLINGNCDYFIYAQYSGKAELRRLHLTDTITMLDKPVSEEKFYIAFSKVSPFAKYLPQFNKLIEKYLNDGTIDMLFKVNNKLAGI